MHDKLKNLNVEIFADGADLDGMLAMYENPLIKGFTTNPTLMRKGGVEDYEAFAKQVIEKIPDRSLSFEVFADDKKEMERQARKIATWGKNVFVKIPVMNTKGHPSYSLIRRLAYDHIQLNVTAVFTEWQVTEVHHCLHLRVPSYISIFAGRVADTGLNPEPIIRGAVDVVTGSETKIIWASPREVYNIFQADACGCHIITVANNLLDKLPGVGKDLTQFSQETVQMFYDDAQKVGYSL